MLNRFSFSHDRHEVHREKPTALYDFLSFFIIARKSYVTQEYRLFYDHERHCQEALILAAS